MVSPVRDAHKDPGPDTRGSPAAQDHGKYSRSTSISHCPHRRQRPPHELSNPVASPSRSHGRPRPFDPVASLSAYLAWRFAAHDTAPGGQHDSSGRQRSAGIPERRLPCTRHEQHRHRPGRSTHARGRNDCKCSPLSRSGGIHSCENRSARNHLSSSTSADWPPRNWTDEAFPAIIRPAVIRSTGRGGAHWSWWTWGSLSAAHLPTIILSLLADLARKPHQPVTDNSTYDTFATARDTTIRGRLTTSTLTLQLGGGDYFAIFGTTTSRPVGDLFAISGPFLRRG